MRRMFLNDKWTSKKGSIVNKRDGDEEEEEKRRRRGGGRGGGGRRGRGGEEGGWRLKRMIRRVDDHIVNT